VSGNDLFVNVAHQVRTPLSVIRGYAELLAVRDDDATRIEAASQIREATDVLALMVDDLLVAFAVEAAVLPVEPEPLDLATAVDEAVASVVKRCPQHSFGTRWPDGGAAAALGDSEHVSRVLTALLLTACRLSPGGGEVEIRGQDAGDKISVSVTHAGPGLDDAELVRAFELNGPLPTDDASGLRSSGLELYNVRRLIELQGGSVAAERGPSGGSTFTFTLPWADPGEAA
jgi:two-component system phosphate regulon sensor histidine kinase PhoR